MIIKFLFQSFKILIVKKSFLYIGISPGKSQLCTSTVNRCVPGMIMMVHTIVLMMIIISSSRYMSK